MTSVVLITICHWLEEREVSYRLVNHVETRTSEESAQARGEPLEVGGKAILMKTDDKYRLFVLSARLKVESAKIKRQLGIRKLRFATAEELLDLTGLVPGSVPPFGRPILPFELYVDHSVLENERIAFNAGSLTDSIIMSTQDYQFVANATLCDFAKTE